MRYWFPLSLFLVTLLSVSCIGRSDEAVTRYQVPEKTSLQTRTFESLRDAVKDNYVYEDLLGSAWAEAGEEAGVRLQAGLETDAFETLMSELLSELPDGTASYQSRQARIDQAVVDNDSYEGIGAFVSVRTEPDARVIVLFVMPGSPAEEAGLKDHDAILAIDGDPIDASGNSDPIARVRGPSGTDVAFTVRSPGEEARELIVTRGRIDLARYRLAWDTMAPDNVGYFLFPPVNYDELLQDFVLGMRALDTAGPIDGLILDLRIVSAGADWPVGSLLTLFSDGVVGEFYSRFQNGPVDVAGVDDFVGSQELPLALIVGPTTTGSAEIFAATLQAAGRATLVGAKTSGQIETVSPFHLPDGSRIFLATSSYRSGDGRELGLLGLEPDLPISADWDQVTPADDPAIDAALGAVLSGSG